MNNSSKPSQDLEFLSDPWEKSISNLNNNYINNSVKLMIEVGHLLPVVEEQKLLAASDSKISSIQIIIKNLLKTKTQVTQKISRGIQEEIALLLLLSKKSQLL